MKLNETKSELKDIVKRSERLKREIGAAVEVARMLMNEEDVHELKDLSLQAGSNLASIESHLNEFARVTHKSRRFAVKTN